MALFDIFSGSSGRRTAQQNIGLLQGAQSQIDQRLGLGQNNAVQTIGAYEPMSLAALGQGYDQARGQYQGAADQFNPYAQTGGQAFNLLANSYGVNGPEGNAAAVGAFQASPGYQYAVDQSSDALARHAASLGTAGGGNVMAAIADRAGQAANQEFGNWRSGLSDLGKTGFAATGTQAGLQKGVGDLYAAQGTGTGNVFQQNAGRLSDIYTGTATTGANAIANTTSGIVNQNTLGQQAGQQASQNQWNAGLSLLGLGAGLAGRYYGGRATA